MRCSLSTVEFTQAADVATSHKADVEMGDGAAVVLSIAPTRVALPASRQWSLLLASSVLLSLIAHTSILIWLLVYALSPAGGAGQELEAIGVEIVDASALDSIVAPRAAAAAGAAFIVAAEAGSEVTIPQPEVTPATPPLQRVEAAQSPTATLKAEPDIAAEIAVADVVRERPDVRPHDEPRRKPSEEPEPVEEPAKDQAPDKAAQVEQHAAVAGGATSSGTDASEAAAGAAASASPGQLARFAMQVRGALGRTRPRHLGARGRVHVAFVLTDGGELLTAEIARSSAHPRLDEAALQAVRTTPFPRPPAGATESQRSFVVPFDFK